MPADLVPAFPSRKRRGRMVKLFTPESDFMEQIEVEEGSPRHLKFLRDAAQMEPDGPEALQLRQWGVHV